MPLLSLIAAKARNDVIGLNNALPWRLPEDLQYFRRVTLGHPILMGRKTFDSIGRPLPGRTSIVLTRDPHWHAQGCIVATDINAAIEAAGDAAELFVIGGSELYTQTLPQASRPYLTEIDADFAGDAWFPDIDWAGWQALQREHHPDNGRGFAFDFAVYQRNP